MRSGVSRILIRAPVLSIDLCCAIMLADQALSAFRWPPAHRRTFHGQLMLHARRTPSAGTHHEVLLNCSRPVSLKHVSTLQSRCPKSCSSPAVHCCTLQSQPSIACIMLSAENRCGPCDSAGLPAISVPFTLDTSDSQLGLPVGVQLIGQAFGEERLLQLAHIFEQTVQFADKHQPPMHA